MKKDLKDYAHLYIGCKVIYPGIDGNNITATLTGVSKTDGIETTYSRKRNGCKGDYLSWKSNGNHNCDALHVKLILRPLSSITDEECTEYNHIQLLTRTIINPFFDQCMSEAAKTKYLLENGFDIFNLHADGLAVH